MKFKINLKPPRDPKIGDVIEIRSNAYVITEFRQNDLGKRIWGTPVNGDKLTHLCGVDFFKSHVLEGKIKILHHVQD